MTTFAHYLQANMDKRGWKRSELAKAAGVNRAVVTEYLNNGVVPQQVNRQKIADALRVSIEEVNAAADGSPTRGVFELSPERQADAQTLNRSQAELVYEIIRHLAAGNRVQQEERDAVRSAVEEFTQKRRRQGGSNGQPAESATETVSDVPLDPSGLGLAARERGDDDPGDEQIQEG